MKTVEVMEGKVLVRGIAVSQAEELQQMFNKELDISMRGDVVEIVPPANVTPINLAFEIGDHFGHTISGLKGHHRRVVYA